MMASAYGLNFPNKVMNFLWSLSMVLTLQARELPSVIDFKTCLLTSMFFYAETGIWWNYLKIPQEASKYLLERKGPRSHIFAKNITWCIFDWWQPRQGDPLTPDEIQIDKHPDGLEYINSMCHMEENG